MSSELSVEVKGKIWERQRWEDELTFRVFRRWLLMFGERDIHEAYRKETGKEYTANGHRVVAPNHILTASRGNGEHEVPNLDGVTWHERAKAFDIDQQRKDLLLRHEQHKRIRATEVDAGKRLLEIAYEMLNWPLYEEEETETPEGITIIRKPAKWALRDARAMIEVASQLMRKGTEMDEPVQKLMITFSPETLEAIEKLEARGMDVTELARQYEKIIQEAANEYG